MRRKKKSKRKKNKKRFIVKDIKFLVWGGGEAEKNTPKPEYQHKRMEKKKNTWSTHSVLLHTFPSIHKGKKKDFMKATLRCEAGVAAGAT